MTSDWEDQMISEAQEYAPMELVLLLLMLTASLNIWVHRTGNEESRVLVIFCLYIVWHWASHICLNIFLHLKTEGIGLDP